jgi:hypothetical protein
MTSMASAAHSVQEDGAAAAAAAGGGGGESASSSSRHLITAEAGQIKSFLIDKWRKRNRGCLSGGKAKRVLGLEMEDNPAEMS